MNTDLGHDNVSPRKVVVVGGGAAGLAATYTLRRHGTDVTLFEASDRAGGRMYGEIVDGFYVDSGACIFHETQQYVERFCEELGISFDLSPRNHVGTIHGQRGGYKISIESMLTMDNIRTLFSFDLFSFKEILQIGKFGRFLKDRRDDLNSKDLGCLLDLDTGENFVEFARRVAGDGFAHGGLVESFFNIGTLAPPERMGSLQGLILIWDFVFGYPDKRTRNPERGIAEFAIALADACKGDTKVSSPVERIVIEEGEVKGVILETGDFVAADVVICTTTASVALQIMPNLPSKIASPLKKVTYSSCCHAAFGVEGHPLQKPTYIFSFVPRSKSFIAAYFDCTVASPLAAPPGKGLIHVYPREEYTEEFIKMSDDEITRRFIDELQKYEPSMPDEPLFTRVHRWKEAVFLAENGVMTELQELRRQDFPGVSGLVLAGDYMRMMGVDNALGSGVEAARRVIEGPK